MNKQAKLRLYKAACGIYKVKRAGTGDRLAGSTVKTVGDWFSGLWNGFRKPVQGSRALAKSLAAGGERAGVIQENSYNGLASAAKARANAERPMISVTPPAPSTPPRVFKLKDPRAGTTTKFELPHVQPKSTLAPGPEKTVTPWEVAEQSALPDSPLNDIFAKLTPEDQYFALQNGLFNIADNPNSVLNMPQLNPWQRYWRGTVGRSTPRLSDASNAPAVRERYGNMLDQFKTLQDTVPANMRVSPRNMRFLESFESKMRDDPYTATNRAANQWFADSAASKPELPEFTSLWNQTGSHPYWKPAEDAAVTAAIPGFSALLYNMPPRVTAPGGAAPGGAAPGGAAPGGAAPGDTGAFVVYKTVRNRKTGETREVDRQGRDRNGNLLGTF